MSAEGKTIRQIAEEIGVSKQAVQKKITREPLYTLISTYIETKDGTKYIEVAGENLIKQAFFENKYTQVASNEPYTSVDNVHTDVYTGNPLYDLLKTELEAKNIQIGKLQDENERLTIALENMTESLRASQALHAGTIQNQLTSGADRDGETSAPPKNKKSWHFWKK